MHLWLLPRIFGVTLSRAADPRSRALFSFLVRLRLLLRCRAASLLSAGRADTLLHFGENDYLGSSFHVSARETLLRLVSTVKRFSAVHFAYISTTAEFLSENGVFGIAPGCDRTTGGSGLFHLAANFSGCRHSPTSSSYSSPSLRFSALQLVSSSPLTLNFDGV